MHPVATRLAVTVAAMLSGCATPRTLPVPPSAEERAAAATSPESLVGEHPPTGECAAAHDAVDRAMAEGALDRATELLASATKRCGDDHGGQWRAGWIARRKGAWDVAAHAFLRELETEDPMPWTGAALLELMPMTSAATRQRISRVGSRDLAIGGGWRDVDRDRIASVRCDGRGFEYGMIACGEDYCRYRVVCRGGGAKWIYYGRGGGRIPAGIGGMLDARLDPAVGQRHDSASP